MVCIKTIFFLLFQHFVVTSCNAVTGHHQNPRHSLLRDKAALLQFKKVITFDPNSTLANWNEANDVCNFTGVGCNKQRHRVTQLVLHSHEIVGQLSPFISNLTGLRDLELVGNHFYGTIPHEISLLRRLHHLWIEGNSFHGSIPDSLVLPSQLTVVDLFQNNFSGAVPPALFSNCSVLVVLDISNNFLSGEIPREISGELLSLPSDIRYLNLSNNKLSGTISFLCSGKSSRNMEFLDLSSNSFSGELPNCWNHLENLVILDLSNNSFSGKIPTSIGSLASLETLGSVKSIDFSSNRLDGEIPHQITDLNGLVSLNLSRNYLTGQMPPQIGKLQTLEFLDLSRNHLYGRIPRSLTQIDLLCLLDLSNNNLSGKIPTGTQLQSFNPSTYAENPQLCGLPLSKACATGETRSQQVPKEDEDELRSYGFYVSMGLGFVVGFWGVCGSWIFNRSWRYTFFGFLDALQDWLYLRAVLIWRQRFKIPMA